MTETQAKGIKETMEVLDLFETTADQVIKAAEDGDLDLLDLPKVVPILQKLPTATAGLDQVWPELRDLDQAEAQTIFGRLPVILSKGARAIQLLMELKG